MALTCEGIEVIHLTHEQISDDEQASVIAETLRKKLGVRLSAPSVELLRKRAQLRSEVLVDWETLGQPQINLPHRS